MTKLKSFLLLDSGWVHHYPNSPAHGLGWEVLGELSPHGSSVAVWPGHLAPNDAKVGLIRLWLSGNGSLVLGLKNNKR